MTQRIPKLARPRTAAPGHRVLQLLVLVLFAMVGATLRLFVWPASDDPQPADAIVVLDGSPRKARQAKGILLARSGYAPVLVVSVPSARPCSEVVPGVEVVNFSPDPVTTQGEARHVAGLAKSRDWKRIIVVSAATQATRARLRIGRCWGGQVLMDPVGFSTPWRWAYQIAYEWAALAKALIVERSC